MVERFYIGFAVPASFAGEVESVFPRTVRDANVREGVVEDWTPVDALHCTLVFIGDLDDSTVVTEKMQEIAAAHRSVQLRVDGPTVMLNGHLAAPVTGADPIASACINAFGHISQDPELSSRPFFGHVTIARVHDPGRADRLVGRHMQHAWLADRIELVRSNGRGANPRYSTTASAALDPATA